MLSEPREERTGLRDEPVVHGERDGPPARESRERLASIFKGSWQTLKVFHAKPRPVITF